MADFTVLYSTGGAYTAAYVAVLLYSAWQVSSNESTSNESGVSFCSALTSQVKNNLALWLAIAVHVSDQASDYEACLTYYNRWQRGGDESVNSQGWFIVCLTILIVHRVISTVFTWNRTRDWVATLLQLTDLSMARSVLSDVDENGQPSMDRVDAELSALDALLESFPQLLLSMVFLLRTQQSSTPIIIQSSLSVVSLAMRICNQDKLVFPAEFHKLNAGCQCPCGLNFKYLARVILFRICEVVQRAAVLTLFWALVGGPMMAALIAVDFAVCKGLSYYWFNQAQQKTNEDGNEKNNGNLQPQWVLDWQQPDFYSYILYFRPGVDHFNVWYYARPMMSVAYALLALIIALVTSKGNRMRMVRSELGWLLFMAVAVGTIAPWIFKCFIERKQSDDGNNYDLRVILSTKPVIISNQKQSKYYSDVEQPE